MMLMKSLPMSVLISNNYPLDSSTPKKSQPVSQMRRSRNAGKLPTGTPSAHNLCVFCEAQPACPNSSDRMPPLFGEMHTRHSYRHNTVVVQTPDRNPACRALDLPRQIAPGHARKHGPQPGQRCSHKISSARICIVAEGSSDGRSLYLADSEWSDGRAAVVNEGLFAHPLYKGLASVHPWAARYRPSSRTIEQCRGSISSAQSATRESD